MIHQHDHRQIAGIAQKELGISGFLFVVAMLSMVIPMPVWVLLLIGWYVVLKSGYHFHHKAIASLKAKQATMDVLVSMSTLSAMIWSTASVFLGGHQYVESAIAIIFFVLLGAYLEERQRQQARKDIRMLFAEHPTIAHRIQLDGSVRDVSVELLMVGDRCLIKAGETVPQDGVVVTGQTTVDESMFTGEPLPAEKEKGDSVFGGTINKTGVIEVEITSEPGAGIFNQMKVLVEQALSLKAPIEKLADKISAIFVPFVALAATVTMILWMYVSDDTTLAVRNAIAVLVIACPCALGIATPAAVMVGTSRAARRGIFLKDGSALEMAHKVNLVLFDKTGTLTEGRPVVTDLLGDEKMVLNYAASIEIKSEHPLASSIVQKAKEKDLVLLDAISVETVPGKGIKGVLNGKTYSIGTVTWMKEQGFIIEENLTEQMNTLRAQAKTVVCVAEENVVIGALAISDTIRVDAKQAIDQLKELNIDIAMVTGDHQASAKAIADQLGIDQVLAETLPTKKAEIVKKLVEQGRVVAFIGDGVNDAPALANASLGIAMGTGTDIAKAAGQMVLMSGKPTKAIEAMEISAQTYQIIKQNLFWAFIYNVVGLALAAFGYVHPGIAGFAMILSSVSVLANSLRVARKV